MNTLAFSPLTHHELNARHDEALLDAGYRVKTVLRVEGAFRPDVLDVQHLEKCARAAEAYHEAAKQRCAEVTW